MIIMALNELEGYPIIILCVLLTIVGLVIIYCQYRLDDIRGIAFPGHDWAYYALGGFFILLGIWGDYREMANRRLKRIGEYDYTKTRMNQKWF